MAEESKEIVAPEAPLAPENKGGKRDNRKPREDQTPIEELFDLTKPIPRVDRPEKELHEAELDALNNEVKVVQEERQKVQDAIEKKMNTGKNSEMGIIRESLSKLRAKKGALIDEKKQIFAKLDGIKAQGDKLAKDRKETRSNVKFHKVEDIDKEIARLRKEQETTSMKLSDEKKLIKEMEQLQSSKSLVAGLKATEGSLEDVKEQRKAIGAQISVKDKEIDEVQKEISEQSEKIKVMSDKETDKRDVLKELFTKRDELRKQINDIFKKKDASRAEYREQNNAWYNWKRATSAQKKIEYEADKKRRDEEQAEWLKKKEEEEAKKIPYEEEQTLCDYLADYLTRTYLIDKEAETKKAAEEAEAKKAASIVPVSDDPFAGFAAVNKKVDDTYFGKGKSKKKRDRAKKKEEKAVAGPFTVAMDTFEQFALVGLAPPTANDQVAKTVEDLKAKKVWFSEQPRGSVPTATEIRKANEKAAAKLKSKVQENGAAEPAKPKANKGGNFSLSTDDFAPLGAGNGASSINSSWGQKPAAEESVAEETTAEE